MPLRKRRRRRRKQKRRASTPASVVEAAVLDVLADIPLELTVRQVYYQLVSRRIIPNTPQAYGRFVRILSNIRRQRSDVDARIVDRTRPLYKGEASLWNGQGYFAEIWLEKDALSTLVRKVASTYGCTLQVTRSYPSISVIRDLSNRVPEGRRLVVLYLGDFDPSGEDIFRHISEETKKNFSNVILEKIALKKEDIKKYGLPPIPAKRTDPRYRKFVKKHGRRTVELDALPPQILLKKITDAILRFIDTEAQAQIHYGTFVDSASIQLVDRVLRSVRKRLLETAQTHLHERLEREALVEAAKERLDKGLAPRLAIPEDLQRVVLANLAETLTRGGLTFERAGCEKV